MGSEVFKVFGGGKNLDWSEVQDEYSQVESLSDNWDWTVRLDWLQEAAKATPECSLVQRDSDTC